LLPLGSVGAFERRPAADDACGEALLETLFDRTPANDHAPDQERVQGRGSQR
jgi:hypothetical protein